MEINTFSLYLQGDAKRPKGIPTQSMGTRIMKKFTGRIFTKKITNLSSLKYMLALLLYLSR
jgi:hypothetical protein